VIRMDVSLVLPTLNEADNIEKLVDNLERVLKKNKLKGELIIVDDESEDGTAELARKINKKYGNVKILIRTIRDGAGAAHLHGYKHAKGDVVISMEADNSCDPEDIPRIVEKIRAGNDIVVASRYADGASTNKSFANILISRLGNVFISRIYGIPINDFTIAYRGFRREIIDKINCVEKDGNPFLMEFIVKANMAGYKKIIEIPTKYTEREFGVSKNKLMKAIPRTFRAAIRIRLTGN
jgi:dolichol-phosphate mannosyltransferase